LAKDHQETNPIPIKLETASHVAEQFSWVPLPYCSPPGKPRGDFLNSSAPMGSDLIGLGYGSAHQEFFLKLLQ